MKRLLIASLLIIAGLASASTATAQKVDWAWNYNYAVYSALPTEGTVWVIMIQMDGKGEWIEEGNEFDREIDAAWQLFRLMEWGLVTNNDEVDIVEREPTPNWQLDQIFTELEPAINLYNDLIDDGFLAMIETIIVPLTEEDLLSVSNDYKVEIPSKPDLIPGFGFDPVGPNPIGVTKFGR